MGKYLNKIVGEKIDKSLNQVKWYGRPASLIPGADYADMLENRASDFTDAVYNLSGKGRKKSEKAAMKAIERIRSGKTVAYRVEDESIPASETMHAESYGQEVDKYSILGERSRAGWQEEPTFMSNLFNFETTDPDTIFIAGGRSEGDVRVTQAHEAVHDAEVYHDTEISGQSDYDMALEPFRYE